ncbi:hypothetical protein [Vibrio diabolicus]
MIKVVIVEDDPNIAELHHHFIEQVEQYQVSVLPAVFTLPSS